MAFYTFSQNNSGGFFESNNEVRQYVIIEAKDFNQANEIAESIGIYFNGCSDGIDCSCCGDRWYKMYDEGDAEDFPSIYGDPAEQSREEYIIYYLNGDIKSN